MRTPRLVGVGLVFIALVAVAGCGPSTTTTPSAAPTASLAPPLGGQTDTEWGRIWDTLPEDFPIYPGATPSDEAADGPVSGMFVIEGTDARTIAAWTADQLIAAGYDVNGQSDALEDGSYAIDGELAPDCQVHVETSPLGGLTSILVLYGASCPNA